MLFGEKEDRKEGFVWRIEKILLPLHPLSAVIADRKKSSLVMLRRRQEQFNQIKQWI